VSAAGIPVATKAHRYLSEITPDLLRLLEDAPQFGNVGIFLTIHNSEITSIELQSGIKRRVQPQQLGRGGTL
jgi:hypothetical protein